MADIELVIKIPEEMYASIHNGMRYTDDVRYIMDLIENGTPLEKHDEEIIKKTVESIWGKPPCDNAISRQAVLKQIKANYLASEDIISLANGLEDSVKTLPSVYPQNTDVLDEIKAEIERYQADCDLSCSDDANCRICDRITFDTIYRIIDKYRKGQTDADSD